MNRSLITWTDFSGGNANFVWRGKQPGDCEFSPGCSNCYVMRFAPRVSSWPDTTTFFPDKLASLIRFRPDAKFAPYRQGNNRPMVFVCDTGDYLHRNVTDDQVFAIWDALFKRADVDWQLLTKRARRLNDLAINWLNARKLSKFPPHMWLGVTIENEEQSFRWEYLRAIPAFVRYISYEPAIGFLKIESGPEWVIIGGESGRSRNDTRPMSFAYVSDAIDSLKNETAIYFKQWGNWIPFEQLSDDDKRKSWHLKTIGQETFVWFTNRANDYDSYYNGKLLHQFPKTESAWDEWDKLCKLTD